jgi:hypothetical protein
MRVLERCRRDEAPPFEMRRCGVAQLSFRLLACPFCNPERQEGFEQFCESKRPRRAVRVRICRCCARSAFALGWLRGLGLRGGLLRSGLLHSFLAGSVAINAYGESTINAREERGNCHGLVLHTACPGPELRAIFRKRACILKEDRRVAQDAKCQLEDVALAR